ncbi:MAG: hypothetical protein KDE63_03310 [Novosphingobium sp.]|nr:hypothetical protein [Novosphingobium sp.]
MNAPISRGLSLAALGLLAACGSGGEDGAGKSGATAPAEIVDGTISDAMLPLDTVRSQAPQADAESLKTADDRKPATTDSTQTGSRSGSQAQDSAAAPSPAPTTDPISEAISGGGQ